MKKIPVPPFNYVVVPVCDFFKGILLCVMRK